MATSSRRSSAPVLPVRSPFHRAGPFYNSTTMTSDASRFTSASSSSFASASSTSYYSSSPSAGFFNQQRRSASPTRVKLHALSPPPPSPSVRFSIDRSISPRRSIAATPRNQVVQRSGGGGGNIQKRTCMCSPTTHPGSFRCAMHKNSSGGGGGNHSVPYAPNRLNMRRSAMTNSLVRIGTVEGDLMKRALAALIRPSSHQQRRRADFQMRRSRLSVMSKAEDLWGNNWDLQVWLLVLLRVCVVALRSIFYPAAFCTPATSGNTYAILETGEADSSPMYICFTKWRTYWTFRIAFLINQYIRT